MKNVMKFLTLCVLAGVVVAMCGCTSPSNNAVPTVTSTVHINNTTKAAVKTTKAVAKPTTTVKPAATVTPASVATPVPAVATPVATATPYPTLKNLHGDESGQMMNPTPTPTQAPTFAWTQKPQAPVMKGGDAFFAASYESHTTGGSGAFYTPHWFLDGKPTTVGTPTSGVAMYWPDTNTLSLGVHTVSVDAMGLPGGTLTLSTTFTVIAAA